MINQKDFVRLLAEKENIQIKDSERVWQGAIDLITELLQKGEVINFSGFGKFKVHKLAAHKGKNPITKEEMWIDDIYTPKFNAGKVFKDAIKKSPTSIGGEMN